MARAGWLTAGAIGMAMLASAGLAAADAKAPAGANMAELRAQTGRPNAIRFDESGGQVWEYNDRRTGWGAFVLSFDDRGVVSEVRQLRTPELVARVRPGETRARELLDMLGEPHRVELSGGDPVWEYCQPGGGRLRVRLGPGQTVAEVAAGR